MTSLHLRIATLGAMLGLLIALTPGCTKKCAPDNCSGCCDAKGTCVSDATSTGACGSAGGTCAICSDTQSCSAGMCVATSTLDGGMMVDAGPPPCHTDFDCQAFNNGSICDLSTNTCGVGVGCGTDSDCQSSDSTNRCFEYGQQCTCDKHDAPAGSAGTCRVRLGPCQECTTDQQCGSDPIIFGLPDHIGTGKCAALMGDTTGKKYCLYQNAGQCGCGTVDDGTGYCRPQSNSCSAVGCNLDNDCPSGNVCSQNNPDAGAGSCGGVCIPRCRWDFTTMDLVQPGCPPGQTCWVDSANLDPTSIYFGSGRCRPACTTNADCQLGPANPFGGANLKCSGETIGGGGMSPSRCRANGQCMDNAECPALPGFLPDGGDQPYVGYCDRGNFTCKQDCRIGNDPVTNLAYTDCKPPYACSAGGPNGNFCKLLTCAQQGGAAIACSKGEYCCGEDKNADGVADPCPPLAQQNAAGCYKATTPPFCTTCMMDSDCKNPTLPAWETCTNGAKNPACSTLPNLCLYAGDRMPGMMGINVCAPATINDTAITASGSTKANIGCPRGWAVTWVRPNVNGDMAGNYCQTNADCQVGNSTSLCEPDPELKQQDGGMLKSCRCATGSGVSQCPNTTDGGVTSTCKSVVGASRAACIESVTCMPPAGGAYAPVNNYGCGL
jgi:hypothetical protein